MAAARAAFNNLSNPAAHAHPQAMPSRSSSRSKSAARSPAAAQIEDPQQQQLSEATAALAQRNAELALISRIQQGIAKKLGFQAIVDLVGDTLVEVFKSEDLSIRWWDDAADTIEILYCVEDRKSVV